MDGRLEPMTIKAIYIPERLHIQHVNTVVLLALEALVANLLSPASYHVSKMSWSVNVFTLTLVLVKNAVSGSPGPF